MRPYEVMVTVEEQATQLQGARAVLDEVCSYVENKSERQSLPRYAEHIALLLMVVHTALYNTEQELNKVTAALQAKSA